MTDMPPDKNHSESVSKTCSRCGKLSAMQTGSMTSWLFRSSACSCESTAVLDAPPEPVVVEDLLSIPNPYQFVSVLGQGGIGSVYKVQDRDNSQFYALKILKRDFLSDPLALQRFQQESKAAQRLPHPNLSQIFESGVTEDGHPYLCMEYVAGENLTSVLRSQVRLDWKKALAVFIQIADAMEFAHKRGVVHRDLNPNNVILTKSEALGEHVKVVDFGIAKLSQKKDSTAPNLTQAGDVFGTPLYMSPEQCTGEDLDSRSDIYSFGCLMYEVLTGKVPFNAKTAVLIMVGHLQTEPPSFAKSCKGLLIPKRLESLVMRCLEKDPNKRPQSMQLLKTDLESIRDGDQAINVAVPKFVFGGLALMSVLVIAGLSFEMIHSMGPKLRSDMTATPLLNKLEEPVKLPASLPLPISARPKIQKKAETENRTAEIDRIERILNSKPGNYDYSLRNKLRHLYGRNERKMMEQNDIILQHEFDSRNGLYIMNCLDWWQSKKNPEQAITYLTEAATNYPQFKFLRAACLMRIGDIQSANEHFDLAKTAYEEVANMKDPALARYIRLAKQSILKLQMQPK